MAERRQAIRAALGAALGLDRGDPELAELELRPAGGGCINEAATCALAGRTWFLKWNQRPLPRQFEAEARGLESLRAAETGLAVPAPLCWSDARGASFLALEFLPTAARRPDFDERLGRGLAALHAQSDPRGFGFELDGYCGATPQPNAWRPSWVEFYREQRLGHQLRLAAAAGFPAEGLRLGERVLARLEELVADPEPSALIHGDLWSGNLHAAASGPGLIDPAASYSDREAELGMMLLFGGFSRRVLAAYDEAYPLQAGWEERVELYSLYHVLNHFNLFGGGYASQALGLLRRYA